MREIKLCYKVEDFEFDNIEDAEKFNKIYDKFKTKEQLQEIYLGIKNKIDYSIYARPEFNSYKMELIRQGLEKGLDVNYYAKIEFNLWVKFTIV